MNVLRSNAPKVLSNSEFVPREDRSTGESGGNMTAGGCTGDPELAEGPSGFMTMQFYISLEPSACREGAM